jgi:hypothetical protein
MEGRTLNLYQVFVKKGAAATGLGTMKLKANDYKIDGRGWLSFLVGDKVIAHFAPGEWVAVVEDEQLMSS